MVSARRRSPTTKHDLIGDARSPSSGGSSLPAIEPRDLKRFATPARRPRPQPPAASATPSPPSAPSSATAYEDGLIRTNPAAGLRLTQPNRTHTSRGPPGRHSASKNWEPSSPRSPPTGGSSSSSSPTPASGSGRRSRSNWSRHRLSCKQRLQVRRRLDRGRIDTPKSSYGTRTIPLATNPHSSPLWRPPAPPTPQTAPRLPLRNRRLPRPL